ncbi:MAG TPA: ABC transporter permease [Clostridiales bacterium]|nr:ABC transporter permease [Clostridiales bacterium]
MRLNKIGYLIKEGFVSIFAHGFMSFASVTIIIACLIIMGSFSLLAVNIDKLIVDLEQENEIVAFIDEALSDEDAMSLEPRIVSISNISSVKFVAREQAMDSFVSDYENKELFEDIDPTVFRHRYVIYLEDITLMEQTKKELEKITGIARVKAHLEIAKGFITVRNMVSAISLILVVILLTISIFIMANTIKLTTFGRREEIAIMKMVGASNSFIRCPFVVEGLILGLVGSGLAFLIQWGIYTLVSDKVMASIAGNIVSVIPFTVLMYPVLIVFAGIGILVGAFGGIIAIRNFLKV